MTNKFVILFLCATAAALAQPTPTEATWVTDGQNANAWARETVGNRPSTKMPVCPQNLTWNGNFDTGTLASMEAMIDTFAQGHFTCVVSNIELGRFLEPNTGGNATVISNIVAAIAYARTTYGMTVRLRPHVSSEFIQEACANTNAWCNGTFPSCFCTVRNAHGICTTPPFQNNKQCFTSFANFNTAWLQGIQDGNVSGGGVGALATYNPDSLSLWHETSGTNNAILNFDGVTIGSPTDYQSGGGTDITAIRAIGGTCTNCATEDISIDVLGGNGLDAVTFAPILAQTAGLTTLGTEIYLTQYCSAGTCNQDVKQWPVYLANTLTNVVGAANANGLKWGYYEGNVYYWVPYNTQNGPGNSTSSSSAYRGNGDTDWMLHGVNQTTTAITARWAAAHGATSGTIFQTNPFVYLAQYRNACPAANPTCTTPADQVNPNSPCGINGIQCFGDLAVSPPYAITAPSFYGTCNQFCAWWLNQTPQTWFRGVVGF